MSNIILTQIIANYINSWEGHTETVGENYMEVKKILKIMTIDEINTEYNALTRQNLWNDPLMDLFYNEVRNRIFEDTSFAISTSWVNIKEWMNNPFVLIRIGIDETYDPIKSNGYYINGNDNITDYINLTQDSFSKKIKDIIIHIILNDEINSIVELGENRIDIIGLESVNDPDESIVFVNKNKFGLNEYKIKSIIQTTDDWNLIKLMYKGLRSGIPTIIDPDEDVLINQLINLKEAEKIVRDGGLTFEGNQLIEAKINDE